MFLFLNYDITCYNDVWKNITWYNKKNFLSLLVITSMFSSMDFKAKAALRGINYVINCCYGL